MWPGTCGASGELQLGCKLCLSHVAYEASGELPKAALLVTTSNPPARPVVAVGTPRPTPSGRRFRPSCATMRLHIGQLYPPTLDAVAPANNSCPEACVVACQQLLP